MSDTPYRNLSSKAFWKRSVAGIDMTDVDPVGVFDLKIGKETKVATAGSCFAQHIARHLQSSGFCYYVAEPGHQILDESVKNKFNYGTFSARYGNIYTTRQLIQLFDRAFNNVSPKEPFWKTASGRFKDPFRPNIQPQGFVTEQEARLDREQHLRCVKEMFEDLDVFVFTLGLTECWRSKEDGAVFPLCPGVEGGEFSHDKYEFYNQEINDVIKDLNTFITQLKKVNSNAKVILTVSPVPLMATAAEEQHVLTATTYSKSVLRVAAEMVNKAHSNVHYFPSYEIITGNFNRGNYYAEDLRNVLEIGVKHVMTLFLKHATSDSGIPKVSLKDSINDKVKADQTAIDTQTIIDIECEEELLDQQ